MRGDRDDRSGGGVPLTPGAHPEGKADRWRRRLRSEFSRQVAHTLATRVILLPLGVAVSVLVTRALGPEGRGELAVATTLAAVCVQFTNLGLHTSNTYFVSRRPELLSALTANTLLVSLALGGLGAVVAWAVVLALPRLAPLHGPLLALSLLWVPMALAYMLIQNLLIGIQQVRVSNRVDVAQKLLGIALLAGIIWAGRATPTTAFAANLAALMIGLGAILWALRPHLTRPLAAAPALLLEHARYGLKSYFTSLCAYLMLRIDVLMVQYMRGPEQVGYYSVAVSMADLLYMVPSTVGVLLFPRLSAMPSRAEQWRQTKRTTLAMLTLLAPLAVIASLAAPWVTRLLFGPAFLPAVPAFVWLMPGIVAYGAAFASSFLMSVGLPWPVLVMWGLLVLLNVGLNWVLIARLGFVGASISSSITYVTCFIALTLYARRLAREEPAGQRP
ncbi:MAG TPA: flippase [Vicinamibacteria bacterium]|nr:flippase [Vicinamibacteria bacterium]